MARNRYYRRSDPHDRFWTGFIFVIAGLGLLIEKMDLGLPAWLFTWPSLCIIIGLVIGVRHGFRNPAWFILIGVGVFFLSDEIVVDLDFKKYFFPVIIIAVGLLFLFRPKRKWHISKNDTDDAIQYPASPAPASGYDEKAAGQSSDYLSSDAIDSVSIFSGVKKVVTSKNFRGGDIVCFMGGAEVILSQADIQGPVELEIFQMFGGTKLIVPAHWEVRTAEAVAIFSGVEDKRMAQAGNFDPKKILIIKGVSIFGGIEIKSY